MEIFHQRGEAALLKELAEHALTREFSHLMVQNPSEARSQLYTRMFKEVCEKQARLVAEWLRVGYCQGNMNSDNSALCGVTLDYGPFGFMEKFQPMWNPWVGGGLPYSFGRQPQAAAVNLVGLSEAFVMLIEKCCEEEKMGRAEKAERVMDVRLCVKDTYVDAFDQAHDENCRRKLGLREWDDAGQALYDDLFSLMASKCGGQGIDFTLFWRRLSQEPPPPASAAATSSETAAAEEETEGDGKVVTPATAEEEAALMGVLGPAALESVSTWPTEHREEWLSWARRYWKRVHGDTSSMDFTPSDRIEVMKGANPKFILRNWMAAEAYDAANRGDYTIINELSGVLSKPYEEQSDEASDRWAQVTPVWARGRAGLAYLS